MIGKVTSLLRNLSRKLILASVSVLFLLLFIVISAVVSFPYFIEKPLVRQQLAEQIHKWTGGQLQIKGNMSLTYFPSLVLSADEVQINAIPRVPSISSLYAKNAVAEFDWLPLFRGNLKPGKLKLSESILSIHSNKSVLYNKPDLDVHLIAQDYKLRSKIEADSIIHTLVSSPFEQIELKDSVLVLYPELTKSQVSDQGQTPVSVVQKVNLLLESDHGTSDMRAAGRFEFNKEVLDFEGFLVDFKNNSNRLTARYNFKVTSRMGQVDLDGTLVSVHKKRLGLRSRGRLSAEFFDLRRFVRWTGGNLADGRGIRRLSVSSPFKINASRLFLSKANINLDGNRAIGGISLLYALKRPKIIGTLNFQTIDLQPYRKKGGDVKTGGKSEVSKNETVREKTIEAVARNAMEKRPRRLLHSIDMDLRLSAPKMKLGNFTASDIAASVIARSGKVYLNIADATMIGGHISGQVRASLNSNVPKYQTKLFLKNVNAARLVTLLGYKGLLTGVLDSTVILKTSGLNINEILKTCSGSIKSKILNGGTVGIDLNQLLYPGKPARKFKNVMLKMASSGFQSISADFKVRGGKLLKKNLILNQNSREVYLDGVLDLYRKWIAGKISKVKIRKEGVLNTQENIETTPPQLVFGGAWPKLYINAAKKYTDILPDIPL